MNENICLSLQMTTQSKFSVISVSLSRTCEKVKTCTDYETQRVSKPRNGKYSLHIMFLLRVVCATAIVQYDLPCLYAVCGQIILRNTNHMLLAIMLFTCPLCQHYWYNITTWENSDLIAPLTFYIYREATILCTWQYELLQSAHMIPTIHQPNHYQLMFILVYLATALHKY